MCARAGSRVARSSWKVSRPGPEKDSPYSIVTTIVGPLCKPECPENKDTSLNA